MKRHCYYLCHVSSRRGRREGKGREREGGGQRGEGRVEEREVIGMKELEIR